MVTAVYFLLPHKYRWAWLLAASCFFYMWFIPIYILILFATIVIDYFAGHLIARSTGRRRKTYLVVSIVATCLILAVFKYLGFLNESFAAIAHAWDWTIRRGCSSIVLPLGLSFHTFQGLAYVIEVYRGRQQAERHPGIFAVYVMFYPQLVAGPIERPQNLLHQFREVHRFDGARVADGLKLMLWGFFKKLVIADRLAVFVDEVYGNETATRAWVCRVATVFFAIQIYCDFSALLGHRHRGRSGHGLPVDDQLRPAVPLGVYRRVLEAVAHLALHLVPRLSLHPAGRQPGGQVAVAVQPLRDVRRERSLARGGLDLRHLGSPQRVLLVFALWTRRSRDWLARVTRLDATRPCAGSSGWSRCSV